MRLRRLVTEARARCAWARRPDNVIADVDAINKAHGFSGIPITETGRPGSKLLGVCICRCFDSRGYPHMEFNLVRRALAGFVSNRTSERRGRT